ncbi:MAG: flagellar basal body-associated protein FliL [Desulfovibrionaceae bacterium]
MADDTQALDQPKKKKGGLLKWIIIAVVLLLIGGAAFFFKDKIMAMVGMGQPAAQEQPAADAAAQDVPADMGPNFKGEWATIAPFVANLNDPLGKRYIRIGLNVQLRDKKALEDFNGAEIQVKDMLIRLLGGKQPQDMMGPKNSLALEQEIVSRLNQIIGNGKVVNIFFSEYLMQ